MSGRTEAELIRPKYPGIALSARPHRGKPGGGGKGTIARASAKARAPPGQARWGRTGRPLPMLVQKPSPHRGKPGGGGEGTIARASAKAFAPPGQARWGRTSLA